MSTPLPRPNPSRPGAPRPAPLRPPMRTPVWGSRGSVFPEVRVPTPSWFRPSGSILGALALIFDARPLNRDEHLFPQAAPLTHLNGYVPGSLDDTIFWWGMRSISDFSPSLGRPPWADPAPRFSFAGRKVQHAWRQGHLKGGLVGNKVVAVPADVPPRVLRDLRPQTRYMDMGRYASARSARNKAMRARIDTLGHRIEQNIAQVQALTANASFVSAYRPAFGAQFSASVDFHASLRDMRYLSEDAMKANQGSVDVVYASIDWSDYVDWENYLVDEPISFDDFATIKTEEPQKLYVPGESYRQLVSIPPQWGFVDGRYQLIQGPSYYYEWVHIPGYFVQPQTDVYRRVLREVREGSREAYDEYLLGHAELVGHVEGARSLRRRIAQQAQHVGLPPTPPPHRRKGRDSKFAGKPAAVGAAYAALGYVFNAMDFWELVTIFARAAKNAQGDSVWALGLDLVNNTHLTRRQKLAHLFDLIRSDGSYVNFDYRLLMQLMVEDYLLDYRYAFERRLPGQLVSYDAPGLFDFTDTGGMMDDAGSFRHALNDLGFI